MLTQDNRLILGFISEFMNLYCTNNIAVHKKQIFVMRCHNQKCFQHLTTFSMCQKFIYRSSLFLLENENDDFLGKHSIVICQIIDNQCFYLELNITFLMGKISPSIFLIFGFFLLFEIVIRVRLFVFSLIKVLYT